jgi:diacylglycerol kinase family enzyme
VTPFLLVNPRSGDDSPTAEELVEAAAARGVETHVLQEGEDVAELARAADADALGMAGGDGSLGLVAAVAIGRGLPFVCVPFGTRNHFARDLGLDRDDPLAALAAFDGGLERRVDVGRVDGRVFLNNVSLGLYAGLVHRREHHRRRGEALARARALALLARDRHGLRVTVDGDPVEARVVFVGNNRYDLSLFTVGERPALDEGCLHLYVAAGLLPRGWEERTSRRFEIGLPAGTVRAAADGEPIELQGPGPVIFESGPRELRVLVPPTSKED